MTTQHLLLLDAHQLSLQAWHQSSLEEVQRFSLDEAGQSDFQAWLTAHPDTELSMLANLAEEGFQVETLPYLHGRDRQAVLERKLAQHFFGTPLTLALSLGHLQTHRKEERVLLAALTQPALVDPWLKILKTRHTPFAGLYSLPQLTGSLCRQLELPLDRCLILTVHPHGLRESLVMGGEAVFSRLTPLPDSSIAGTATSIASEAHKLHQYLCSQRIIGRDESLTVCPLVHPKALDAVQAACLDLGALRFQIQDLHKAADQLGLKSAPGNSHADGLFLHLLATHPPRQQFAPTALRHDYFMARIRYGLVASGIVILLAGLLWMSKELVTTHQLQAETARMEGEYVSLQAEYASLAHQIPGLALGPDEIRTLLAQYDQLLRQQDNPCRAMSELSHALDAVPTARLDRLHWECNRVQSTLTVDGNLPATEPRLLVNRFEQLLRALDHRGIRADILTHPVDIAPDKPLRGGDLGQDNIPPPNFKLRLYWEDKS